MWVPGRSAGWTLAVASLALFAGVSIWIGYRSSGPRLAHDYEECAEQAQANASSSIDHSKWIMQCGERFAGRRKVGGGYSYFDFMQNRTFDIGGPNPTESE